MNRRRASVRGLGALGLAVASIAIAMTTTPTAPAAALPRELAEMIGNYEVAQWFIDR